MNECDHQYNEANPKKLPFMVIGNCLKPFTSRAKSSKIPRKLRQDRLSLNLFFVVVVCFFVCLSLGFLFSLLF